jgi:hypothetical protein
LGHKNKLPTAVIGSSNRLAALPALLGAFVLGQVLVKAGKAAEGSAAGWAVVLWLGFIIVAEHRKSK